MSFSVLIAFMILAGTSGEPADGSGGTLEGTVKNEQNNSLPFSHVALPDINEGTITRQDGTFRLSGIAAGEHRVVISHVGYESGEITIEIRDDEITEIQPTLTASREMPQVEIIGRAPERLSRIPGSASVITPEKLEASNPVNATEIFREIPGVHSVDNDVAGLRANIGIRGLDPDRSRNVLMLEDGMPVALAPYGEPEMYYTPSVSRMESIEIVKGSGSIMFGPQTIGGVINYITPDPPPEQEMEGYISGGSGGYLTSRFGYGNTFGNSGLQLTWLHRQADEIGPLSFQLNDVNTKWKLTMGNRSVLGIKMSIYDESSNDTYVGLSQPMYENRTYHFAEKAPHDNLDIRRYSASVTLDHFFSDHVRLRTSAYAYTTQRNWSRQDFDNQPVEGREYSRTIGNTDEPFGALYFRPTTGNRNREFEVFGVEPRLNARFYLGELRNEFDAGTRFLFERTFEQRINGSIESPTTGNIRDDEIRTGHAGSAFVQNRVYLNSRLTLTPGVRMEYYRYQRDVLRNNYENMNRSSTDRVTALIPGFGTNYQIGPQSSFFAGVHRGFSPPRIKDALTATGTSEKLDAEWSWSYEAGFRTQPHPNIRSEFTAYYMNFENQIIPVSESAGGQGMTNAAGLTNGGETVHYGLESYFKLTPFQQSGYAFTPEWELGGTWSRAAFSEDRFVKDGDNIVNIKGNVLPYAPEWSGYTRISINHDSGITGYMKATYTGRQYGDGLNRTEPSGDGRQGILESYAVWDAGMHYVLHSPSDINLSVSVKNLTDNRYISSRRPQGIRLGMPRMITFSVNFRI